MRALPARSSHATPVCSQMPRPVAPIDGTTTKGTQVRSCRPCAGMGSPHAFNARTAAATAAVSPRLLYSTRKRHPSPTSSRSGRRRHWGHSDRPGFSAKGAATGEPRSSESRSAIRRSTPAESSYILVENDNVVDPCVNTAFSLNHPPANRRQARRHSLGAIASHTISSAGLIRRVTASESTHYSCFGLPAEQSSGSSQLKGRRSTTMILYGWLKGTMSSRTARFGRRLTPAVTSSSSAVNHIRSHAHLYSAELPRMAKDAPHSSHRIWKS